MRIGTRHPHRRAPPRPRRLRLGRMAKGLPKPAVEHRLPMPRPGRSRAGPRRPSNARLRPRPTTAGFAAGRIGCPGRPSPPLSRYAPADTGRHPEPTATACGPRTAARLPLRAGRPNREFRGPTDDASGASAPAHRDAPATPPGYGLDADRRPCRTTPPTVWRDRRRSVALRSISRSLPTA